MITGFSNFLFGATRGSTFFRSEVEVAKSPVNTKFSQIIAIFTYIACNSPILSMKLGLDKNIYEREGFQNISQTFTALDSLVNKDGPSFNNFRSIAKTTGILAFSIFSADLRNFKEYRALNVGMALLETSLIAKKTFKELKKCWNISEHKPFKALGFAFTHIASLGVSSLRLYQVLYNPHFIDDIEITPPLSMEERLKNICDNNFLGRKAICLEEFLKIREAANKYSNSEEPKLYSDRKTRLFINDQDHKAFSLEEIKSFTDSKLLAMKDYFSSDAFAKLKQN